MHPTNDNLQTVTDPISNSDFRKMAHTVLRPSSEMALSTLSAVRNRNKRYKIVIFYSFPNWNWKLLCESQYRLQTRTRHRYWDEIHPNMTHTQEVCLQLIQTCANQQLRQIARMNEIEPNGTGDMKLFQREALFPVSDSDERKGWCHVHTCKAKLFRQSPSGTYTRLSRAAAIGHLIRTMK